MLCGYRDKKRLRHLMVVIALTLAIAGTAWAQGMGDGRCYHNPRNPAEAYCSANGGCPKSGNCYFPDGTYCELRSFYNGTCPGTGYIEQAMWNAEIYAFLYGDQFGFAGQSKNAGYGNTGYGDVGYGNAGYGNAVYGNTGSVVGSAAYSAGYWKAEADRYYLAGSYLEAADLYTKAVQLDPTLEAAWLNLGNSLYFLGRYQESLEAYEAALRIDPNNASVWQGKGQALLALNRTGEAQEAFSRAETLTKR